ncbi:MAG: 4Fe-4S cluster-binding domain-containing protein [Eubacterium sp.]|nr:4Fe-4S cluster-binding domain-containing protein [Eubacterium sp.]
MNPYTRNLNRIEFVVTYACTGKCKHCSEGEHKLQGEHLDGEKAAEAVYSVAEKYKMDSLMTFGGEPSLAKKR